MIVPESFARCGQREVDRWALTRERSERFGGRVESLATVPLNAVYSGSKPSLWKVIIAGGSGGDGAAGGALFTSEKTAASCTRSLSGHRLASVGVRSAAAGTTS